MDAEQITILANAIATILDERHKEYYCPLNADRRRSDHEWVKAKRMREIAQTKFFEALTLHIAKWGMIGALSVIGYALVLFAKQSLLK